MPGRKPFGYYRGEAGIIAKMEALREAGLGFDSIADRLNAADIPSRSGKSWSGIVINRILTRGATQTDPTQTDPPQDDQPAGSEPFSVPPPNTIVSSS